MCVRWNTVLKENGQLENTPVLTSPLVPGDTITQCPKQCDPKCCSTTSQSFMQSDQLGGSPQASEESKQDQSNPPACMEGCPNACYPACRPGCCNAPRLMSMYQQNAVQQSPVMQPMQQPFVQQPAAQREVIPNSASSSYSWQGLVKPVQSRDVIPYNDPQVTPARYSLPQYAYTQYDITSQTRATIPQPENVQALALERSNVPKHTAFEHAATCPIPCSPMCAPHCTKHCCESYD